VLFLPIASDLALKSPSKKETRRNEPLSLASCSKAIGYQYGNFSTLWPRRKGEGNHTSLNCHYYNTNGKIMSRKLSHTNDVSISPVYLSARSAIVQPERAIAVTNYSLNKWLPRLGAGRWALVQYLRGLCIDSPRRADGTKRVTISWKISSGVVLAHEKEMYSL